MATESQCACYIDSCLLTAPDSDTSMLFISVHNVYSLQRTVHNGRGDPCTARFLFMAFKGSIMFNFGSEIIIKIIKKDVYIRAVIPLRQLKHSAESILGAFTLSWFGKMHLEKRVYT